MGKIFKALGAIVGLGSAPKARGEPVKMKQAQDDVTQSQDNVKSARAALYSTSGGVQGQELNPNQVLRRQTLLGN